MIIRAAQYSDTGARENNEDACRTLLSRESALAVVADGLGGMDDGEVASRCAVETLVQQLWELDPDEDLLYDAIGQAGNAVYRLQNPGSNMRTTLAVLWLAGCKALASHVGDTRIYQFRDGRILYQSMDHSVAQMAVLLGELSPDSLRSNPDRNRLVRVLGDREPPKVDVEELDVRPGDRFLLCSDGFWEPVTEERMLAAIPLTHTPEQWLETMRRHILTARDPRQDNNTAIALIIDSL